MYVEVKWPEIPQALRCPGGGAHSQDCNSSPGSATGVGRKSTTGGISLGTSKQIISKTFTRFLRCKPTDFKVDDMGSAHLGSVALDVLKPTIN